MSKFVITHYEIISEKLNGLENEKKILFLSDLHNNCYGQKNEKLIQAVYDMKPEYILIGGDMLVGKADVSTEVAEEFVKAIAPVCPIYYANGNHEARMKAYPQVYGTHIHKYIDTLKEYGVQFLENSHVDLMWEEQRIQIHGLEIPMHCYQKFRKVTLSKEEIRACIGDAHEDCFQILLAHNPIFVDTYLDWGADLVLSGHLHGGLVRLPYFGGIITPQFRLFPKYSGELTVKNDKSVVVSKGLGTHTINIRFLNPAELIVLHIKGKRT